MNNLTKRWLAAGVLVGSLFFSLHTQDDFDLDKELASLGSLGDEIEILPTQMKLPKDAKLTFTFPLLGEVTFTAMVDEKGVAQGFQALKPKADAPFVWGPLTIEKGVFKIADGKLSYVGIVKMFGRRATLGLKDFSLVTDSGSSSHIVSSKDISSKKPIEVYRLVLGLTFDGDPATLELIPGKKIELKYLDLTFQEKKGVSFKQGFEFLGQKVEFSGNIDVQKKELNFKAELPECNLVDLVPELKGSLIESFTVQGLVAINPLKGLIFTGSLLNKAEAEKKIAMGGLVLDEAHIDIDTIKKRAFVSGKTLVLGLPLQAYFALFLGDKKGVKFAINIPSLLKEWKPFEKLNVPALSDVTIMNIKAGFYAQYIAMSKGKKTSKKQDEEEDKTTSLFNSKSKSEKSFRDAIKEVKGKQAEAKIEAINQAISESTTYTSEVFDAVATSGDSVSLTGEKGATIIFYISGTSKVMNVVNEVLLKVGTAPGAAITITLFGRLPEGWKLSQSFPQFVSKHDPNNFWDVICDGIDLVKLDDAMFYASTVGETFNGTPIDPGFNIAASASIDTKVDNQFIKGLVQTGILAENTKGANVGFVGNFDPRDYKNASFKMNVSSGGFGIPVGPARFQAANVALVLRAMPSVAVAGGFTMIPAKGETPLDFYIDFAFTPTECGVNMSMKNVWKDPFGVKGFEFGNLGGNATQTYSVIAEAFATAGIAVLIPATFALTGEVKIGQGPCFEPDKPGTSFCAKAGINIGKDITNFALFVDIANPISIVLLAEILLKQMGAQVDILNAVSKLFPVKIKKGKLYFVPMGTTIGEIKIRQGIAASLYLDLLGREAHVDGSIGLDGITAKGKIPAFEIGIIKMTNYDDTCSTQIGVNKPEDVTCGPTIDIQANAQNVHFIIDGLMKFGNLFQSKTKWYISSKGLGFDTETFVGPADANLGIKLKGSSISFEDQVKLFSLQPKDIFIDIQFQDNFSERLRETIIKELRSSQAIFENSINQAMDQLARDTIQKDITDQEAAVKAAEGRRVLCKDDLALCIKREIEVQGEIAKLNSLKLKMELEKSPLTKFFQDLGRKLGFDKVAKGLLLEVKKAGTDANTKTVLAFQDISRLVVIKKVGWKGSLEDIGKGVVPSLEIVICTGCKEITYKTPPFNLADPLTSLDAIAKAVIEIIKQVIIGALRNEKCDNVCGIKESELTTAQDTELAKHILYWQQKGEIDETGQRYDGDFARGQFLLNKMKQENPALAAQLEPYMMPDVAGLNARIALIQHIRYWKEKGRTDEQGRRYDGDPARGRALLADLRKFNPTAAGELEAQMLPDPICADLAEHTNYWRARGTVDRDTSGKGQRLLNECRKYSPAFATVLEKEMLPVSAEDFAPKIAQARAELDKHIAYWLQHGRQDDKGRRYDGDAPRGRRLLEDLRVLDPAAAATYEPHMLPDPICADLAEHTAYWRARGDKDRDRSGKGQRLLNECRKYSPIFAPTLEREMLPVE